MMRSGAQIRLHYYTRSEGTLRVLTSISPNATSCFYISNVGDVAQCSDARADLRESRLRP